MEYERIRSYQKLINEKKKKIITQKDYTKRLIILYEIKILEYKIKIERLKD